jgi:peroxiredoxin
MKKTFILISVVLVVIAALFINARLSMAPGLAVGDYASDFSLKNIDGKMISLSSFKDAKGVIVVFTCNTCPYANGYEQRIIDLNNKYASKGFPMIAINPNDVKQQPEDSMEEMQKRAKAKNYTFPYVRDDSQEVTKKYGATKTPHTYILSNNNGKYRVEFIGAIDDNPRDAQGVNVRYAEDAIDALLSGKTPAVKESRAIGCTIKWKES